MVKFTEEIVNEKLQLLRSEACHEYTKTSSLALSWRLYVSTFISLNVFNFYVFNFDIFNFYLKQIFKGPCSTFELEKRTWSYPTSYLNEFLCGALASFFWISFSSVSVFLKKNGNKTYQKIPRKKQMKKTSI